MKIIKNFVKNCHSLNYMITNQLEGVGSSQTNTAIVLESVWSTQSSPTFIVGPTLCCKQELIHSLAECVRMTQLLHERHVLFRSNYLIMTYYYYENIDNIHIPMSVLY